MKRLLGMVALAVLGGTGPARGQGFEADPVRPTNPASGYFAVDRAEVMPARHLALGAGLVLTRDLLVARDASGAERMAVLENRLALHLLADYSVTDRVQLGLRLPVVLAQDGDADLLSPGSALSARALGDLWLRGKARLWSGPGGLRPTVSAALGLSLPTGDQAGFSGSSNAELEPALLASAGNTRWAVAGDLGYRVRERAEVANLVVDDELVVRVAVAAAVARRAWLIGEAHAAFGVNGGARERPAELMFGGRYGAAGGRLILQAAAGFGLTHGYGSPAVRGVTSVAYLLDWSPRQPAPPPPVSDMDGDGIPDERDGCPNDAEDQDGFEDDDGCPDPDNDGDGTPDVDDACPNEAGPAENRGCPDVDTDGDGVVDRLDRCPTEAEDLDGFEDEDGCPDLDNDGDGIPDALDRCPLEAEDVDGFEDEDGCPDADNDGDGIPDLADSCPNEPETFNGFEDDDGCPDKGKVLVVLTRDKIEIKQEIHFASGKAKIPKRDYKLLATVAKVLILHPGIKHVRIEGHTDSVGSDARNLDLSHKRAEAVRQHLIEHNGIAAERLAAAGYGEERPIADNTSRA
ncbi:MAG TPA: OmpA family protein, partial [Kofleriaceae bacterium]|nr:OmpA family protein [Kofleriaceae bacterium]